MIYGNLNQNLTIWPYVAFDQICRHSESEEISSESSDSSSDTDSLSMSTSDDSSDESLDEVDYHPF